MKAILTKSLLIYFFTACFILLIKQSTAQSLKSLKENKTTLSNLTIENILKHSMFIKVIASSNKVFVGEPLMALYKFYTSVNGQAIVLKQPEFSGCSVNELSFNESPQTETVNGKPYTTFIVRRVQLTPVAPGKLSLGVATVSNHVELSDPGNAFLTDRYDVPVSNDSTSVDVILLPDKNRPADYNGLTGSFIINAEVSDKKIAAGENDHLIITIKGSGNLNAINKPDISWPGNTEHFDGTDSQHIDQMDFPLSGDRIFDIPFIGKKEGTIIIPPINFSYFNTTLKDYQTVSTKNISIIFTKALAKKDRFFNVVNYDVSNRKYLWIVGVIALAAVLIGFINYKRNKNQLLKNEQRTVTPVPVFEPQVRFKFKTDFARYWKDLESLTDIKLFFTKAKELLMMAIAEFTETTHHSELFLLAEMKKKLNDETLCKKIFVLNEVCNEKIYAPFKTETDLHFYFNEVKNAIEELQNKT